VEATPKDSQFQVLSADEVHIWLAEPEKCRQPGLVERYLSWLDEQEQSRYERFRFPHHRHEYLAAHALLRSTLSRYSDCPPEAWSFMRNAYGRPEIAVGKGPPPLRFNLSHTEGLVACAVTRSAVVGVDVEGTERAGDLEEIAAMTFAPAELTDLNALTGEDWSRHFFALWTLKEAYIKAQGKGLSIPLQQIQFRFRLDGVTEIQFASRLEPESTQDWRFALLKPTQQHCLAVAVRLSGPLRLKTGWAMPGATFQATPFPVIASKGVV